MLSRRGTHRTHRFVAVTSPSCSLTSSVRSRLLCWHVSQIINSRRSRRMTVLTIILVLASIRTYAIWNRNKAVLLFMLGLGLIYPLVYTVSSVLLSTSSQTHSPGLTEFKQYLTLRLRTRAASLPSTGCDYYTAVPADLIFGSDPAWSL